MNWNFTIEEILLTVSILLIISIAASKASLKTGIPILILFLGIGILAGSEGLGGIAFDDYLLAQWIGIVSLNFILFSGGLDTKWESVKPILWKGVSLSTLGVVLTAFVLGFFVHFILQVGWAESFLLGSIVSSTDAAAVFSILRSKNFNLKRQLKPTLELESGSNDPMAYVLTIGFIYVVTNQNGSFASIIPLFFVQMIFGGVIGFIYGKIIIWIINNIRLDYDGLYPVLVLALVLFVYPAATLVGGNGFLAVYIAAVVLGNSEFIHKRSLRRFFDGVSWLMQIVMFITLGLLVFPSHIIPVAGEGIFIALFLIFVARPIGVFISLTFSKASFKEKIFVSWVGLRGAAPILFATFPLVAGVPDAETLFNMVFFIVVISVIVQAPLLPYIAKWLDLAVKEEAPKDILTELEVSDEIRKELFQVKIPAKSCVIGKRILELGLPKNSLIILINRNQTYITPNGNTILEANDKLMVMTSDKQEIPIIKDLLQKC